MYLFEVMSLLLSSYAGQDHPHHHLCRTLLGEVPPNQRERWGLKSTRPGGSNHPILPFGCDIAIAILLERFPRKFCQEKGNHFLKVICEYIFRKRVRYEYVKLYP